MVPRFLRSAEHELALLGHAALALQHAVAGEHPWIIAALGWAGPALGALAALFAILVLVGTVLSHLTLRSAEVWSDESARRTATLRRTYTAVLFFISALYYFLLPLVIVGAFGSVGLLIQGIFLVGWLPSTVAQVIGLLLVVSAAAFSKNFFSRWREGEFGVRVGLDRESALLATLQEVAAHIGTRAVDMVYMTPDTVIAVTEEKGGERCLLVGAGLLEGMPLEAFKALLAHEYGHFANRDLPDGELASRVRCSLHRLDISIALSAGVPWNPLWWFASCFNQLFLRISHGALRLNEILADRRAAEVYGGAALATGLRHIAARSLHFEGHMSAVVNRALAANEPLRGLWSLQGSSAADRAADEPAAKAAAEQLAKALARTPSPYDSHPAPADRIRWIERVAGEAPDSDDPTQTAWSLFSDRGRYEREMTRFVQAKLAKKGVNLPAFPET